MKTKMIGMTSLQFTTMFYRLKQLSVGRALDQIRKAVLTVTHPHIYPGVAITLRLSQ